MKSFDEIVNLLTPEVDNEINRDLQDHWKWVRNQVNMTFGKWPLITLKWGTAGGRTAHRVDISFPVDGSAVECYEDWEYDRHPPEPDQVVRQIKARIELAYQRAYGTETSEELT